MTDMDNSLSKGCIFCKKKYNIYAKRMWWGRKSITTRSQASKTQRIIRNLIFATIKN